MSIPVCVQLTAQERQALDHLAAAWNAWCDLPHRSASDNAEFQTAIHDAQQAIALRVARRADPDVWRTPG